MFLEWIYSALKSIFLDGNSQNDKMNFCYNAVIESFLIEKSEEFKKDTSKKVEMFNKTLKILNLDKENNGADIKSNVKRNFCTSTNSTNKRLKTDLLSNVKKWYKTT